MKILTKFITFGVLDGTSKGELVTQTCYNYGKTLLETILKKLNVAGMDDISMEVFSVAKQKFAFIYSNAAQEKNSGARSTVIAKSGFPEIYGTVLIARVNKNGRAEGLTQSDVDVLTSRLMIVQSQLNSKNFQKAYRKRKENNSTFVPFYSQQIILDMRDSKTKHAIKTFLKNNVGF